MAMPNEGYPVSFAERELAFPDPRAEEWVFDPEHQRIIEAALATTSEGIYSKTRLFNQVVRGNLPDDRVEVKRQMRLALQAHPRYEALRASLCYVASPLGNTDAEHDLSLATPAAAILSDLHDTHDPEHLYAWEDIQEAAIQADCLPAEEHRKELFWKVLEYNTRMIFNEETKKFRITLPPEQPAFTTVGEGVDQLVADCEQPLVRKRSLIFEILSGGRKLSEATRRAVLEALEQDPRINLVGRNSYGEYIHTVFPPGKEDGHRIVQLHRAATHVSEQLRNLTPVRPVDSSMLGNLVRFGPEPVSALKPGKFSEETRQAMLSALMLLVQAQPDIETVSKGKVIARRAPVTSSASPSPQQLEVSAAAAEHKERSTKLYGCVTEVIKELLQDEMRSVPPKRFIARIGTVAVRQGLGELTAEDTSMIFGHMAAYGSVSWRDNEVDPEGGMLDIAPPASERPRSSGVRHGKNMQTLVDGLGVIRGSTHVRRPRDE